MTYFISFLKGIINPLYFTNDGLEGSKNSKFKVLTKLDECFFGIILLIFKELITFKE